MPSVSLYAEHAADSVVVGIVTMLRTFSVTIFESQGTEGFQVHHRSKQCFCGSCDGKLEIHLTFGWSPLPEKGVGSGDVIAERAGQGVPGVEKLQQDSVRDQEDSGKEWLHARESWGGRREAS